MINMMCSVLILTLASNDLDAITAMIDVALARTAALVKAGGLSTSEEIKAVSLITNADPALLLLSKHFGGAALFGSHMRAALSATGDIADLQNAPRAPDSIPLTYDPLFARRSVTAYKEQEVSAEVVRRALEAAIHAPNHFLTEPWRFYLAGKETRAKLVALNEVKRSIFEKVRSYPNEIGPAASLIEGSQRNLVLFGAVVMLRP